MAIDPTTPANDVPANKADIRANWQAIKDVPTVAFAETAAALSGKSSQYLRVNSGATGIESVAGSATGTDASVSNYTGRGTGASTRTVKGKLDEVVSVKDFGAVGNGVADDTAAIAAAWDYVVAQGAFFNQLTGQPTHYKVAGPALFFPAGDYIYNGSGLALNRKVVNVFGEGPFASRIQLGSGVWLFDWGTPTPAYCNIHDLQTFGGAGMVRFSATANSNRLLYLFERLLVSQFTVCGIGTNASDMPRLRVRDCLFDGTGGNSIGVAFSGLTDHCEVTGCYFNGNRYSVKMLGGNNARIHHNYFPGAEGDGADVWIVPTNTVNFGHGCVIESNKLSGENLDDAGTIPRILYASEAAGTDFLSKMHATTVVATTAGGTQIRGNLFNWPGSWTGPVIRSFTSNLQQIIFESNVFVPAGTAFGSIVEWGAGVTPAIASKDSVIDLSRGTKGTVATYSISNVAGSVRSIDPWGIATNKGSPLSPSQLYSVS